MLRKQNGYETHKKTATLYVILECNHKVKVDKTPALDALLDCSECDTLPKKVGRPKGPNKVNKSVSLSEQTAKMFALQAKRQRKTEHALMSQVLEVWFSC